MKETLRSILDTGIVAIIRSDSSSGLKEAVYALADGGIKAIEITLTTPGALKVIELISGETNREFIIGAGSVLDAESARLAISVGAEFIVMPNVNTEAIALVKQSNKVVCPGALTPTEIVTAWRAGADIVKVFPVSVMGGATYIKALMGPLPQVRLMPVGGVDVNDIEDYIRVGACGVGIGGTLINAKIIGQGDWSKITQTAKKCIDAVTKGRDNDR